MQRRTVILIVGLLLALASLGGAFCVWAFAPDELEAKLEQVQVGMTPNEVETVMGRQADFSMYFTQAWAGEGVAVWVKYDSGQVDHTAVARIPLWDRIRVTLPWPGRTKVPHETPATMFP